MIYTQNIQNIPWCIFFNKKLSKRVTVKKGWEALFYTVYCMCTALRSYSYYVEQIKQHRHVIQCVDTT